MGNQYRRWVGKEIERKLKRNRSEKEGKEAGKEEQRK